MKIAADSQILTEEIHSNKFEATKQLAEKDKTPPSLTTTGRKSPLVGFSISQEDKDLLDSLALHLSVKKGRIISKSAVQRALIQLGDKYRDELEVE